MKQRVEEKLALSWAPINVFSHDGEIVLRFGHEILVHDEALYLIAQIAEFYSTISPEKVRQINEETAFNVAQLSALCLHKPTPGTLYLLQAGELFKIGITTRTVEERAKEIASPNGHSITIVYSAWFSDARRMEMVFHQFFSKKLVVGEWFRLEEEDIEFFIAHARDDLDMPTENTAASGESLPNCDPVDGAA
ncbi:MAG TPA: GIY-YIG nuclease family protein [Aggregatilinea sp.]|uniref:GIY-YIG nuclease family protein n=1 Tax=Aggregatilinea sp. TaxID=2806333 RepID=UPI002B84CB7C|nr:GIY-YIG nuclease family protein [Aggregatilinea sp.]HML22117.1 GIY-YIG nuclease family protein [Aggregatilinea sp.]